MAKRPILYKAHDPAISNGTAVTNKRVSINNNPYIYLNFREEYFILHCYDLLS